MLARFVSVGAGRVLVGVVGFLLIWEGAARSGIGSDTFLPPLETLLPAFFDLLRQPATWHGVALTLGRAISGLIVAALITILMAALATLWRPAYRSFEMLSDMAQTVPPAALVPLLIFAVGLGAPMFITIVAFASIWPLYVATATGLAATDPVQLLVARALGMSRSERILYVRAPAAVPSIFTGLRVAAGFSLMATIAAEMLSGDRGLGAQLYDYAFSLNVPEMYSTLFIIGLTGALMNTVQQMLENILLEWHFGQMKGANE
jgi:NitT/TauT family transport system permease protein